MTDSPQPPLTDGKPQGSVTAGAQKRSKPEWPRGVKTYEESANHFFTVMSKNKDLQALWFSVMVRQSHPSFFSLLPNFNYHLEYPHPWVP
jgi:hypothetical protein